MLQRIWRKKIVLFWDAASSVIFNLIEMELQCERWGWGCPWMDLHGRWSILIFIAGREQTLVYWNDNSEKRIKRLRSCPRFAVILTCLVYVDLLCLRFVKWLLLMFHLLFYCWYHTFWLLPIRYPYYYVYRMSLICVKSS